MNEKKSRFLEKMQGFIGQQNLKESFFRNLAQSQRERGFPVFLFDGPPGTGKTQFAKKIAEAFEIPFAKINCSLLSDETQLTGIPINYVGRGPGLIYQSLVDSKVVNPV